MMTPADVAIDGITLMLDGLTARSDAIRSCRSQPEIEGVLTTAIEQSDWASLRPVERLVLYAIDRPQALGDSCRAWIMDVTEVRLVTGLTDRELSAVLARLERDRRPALVLTCPIEPGLLVVAHPGDREHFGTAIRAEHPVFVDHASGRVSPVPVRRDNQP